MITVRLENIRSCRDLYTEFYPGINLVVGKNGTGKSTLCNSLYIAFYKTTLWGTRSYKSLVTIGESYGMVDVKLDPPYSGSGDTIQVVRYFNTNPSSGRKNQDHILINGNVMPDLKPENLIPPEILRYVYFQDFKKFNVFEFIDIEPFVNRLNGLKHKLNDKLKVLGLKRDELTIQVQKLDSMLLFYKSKIESLESGAIPTILANIESIRQKLKVRDEDEYTHCLNLVQEAHDLFNKKYNEAITGLKSDITRTKDRIEALRSTITNKKQEYTRVYELVSQNYQKEISNITKSHKANAIMTDPKIKALDEEINGHIHNSKRLANLLNKVSMSNSTSGGSSDNNTTVSCPLCGGSINPIHIKNELDVLEKTISRLNEEKALCIKSIDLKLAEDEERLKNQMQNELQKIRNTYEPEVKALHDELSTLEHNLVELESKLHSFSKDNQVLIDELKADIRTKVYGPIYSTWLNNISIKEQRDLLDLIKYKQNELSILQNQVNEYKLGYDTTLNDIEKSKIELSTVSAQFDEVSTVVDITDSISTRSIKRHISTKLHPILQNICMKVTNNFPIKVFPEIKEVGTSTSNTGGNVEYELIFNVSNIHNEIVPIEELSQGENILAKLAINFVVRDFVNMLPKFKTNPIPPIVIMDEVLDKLDSDNATNVLQYVSEYHNNYCFIIVTHRSDLIDAIHGDKVNVIEL